MRIPKPIQTAMDSYCLIDSYCKMAILIAFVVTWLPVSLLAQSGVDAAGGEATGNGTVSYSVGQIDYITNTGTAGTITQGLQQPYEIFLETGIIEPSINLVIILFPNPTSDGVQLVVENSDYQDLSYALYDVTGKLLGAHQIESGKTIIPMAHLAAGTYLVRVASGDQEIKTYKVIKN